MINIPKQETFAKTELINKGASSDTKYYIETFDSQRLLLRISNAKEYENIKIQHSMLERLSKLGISMSRPIEFGLCENNESIYQLLTWVDGEDLESALPTMQKEKQYNSGLKTGRLLRKIHSIPSSGDTNEWDMYFGRILQDELEMYYSNKELHCEIGEIITNYFRDNPNVTGTHPRTFMHGDYHLANIILMPCGEIGAIDFACGYGDPYWDIFKVAWRPYMYPLFFSGMIRGYFNNAPSIEFWKAYNHYFAYGALVASRAPKWAGFNTLEEGRDVAKNILAWSDNFKTPTPSWYLAEHDDFASSP